MKQFLGKERSIYVILVALLVSMVVLLFGILAAWQFEAGRRRILAQVTESFGGLSREASAAIEVELRPARVATSMLVQSPAVRAPDEDLRMRIVPVLAAAVRGSAAVASAYIATANGSFVLLRRLDTEALRRSFEAPARTVFLVQSVSRDGPESQGRYQFLDADLQTLALHNRPDYRYDPRERMWHQLALAAHGEPVQTDPYRFFTTQQVGVTVAESEGLAVAGADVNLAALQRLLVARNISPSAELMIVNAQGGVLAHKSPQAARALAAAGAGSAVQLPLVAELGSTVLNQTWAMAQDGEVRRIEIDGREWIAQTAPLEVHGGQALRLAMAAPLDELQADALRQRRRSFAIAFVVLLLTLPLAHLAARAVTRPLKDLADQVLEIRNFNFAVPDAKPCLLREVNQLGQATDSMKHSLARFRDISAALSAERPFSALLNRLLVETLSVAQASSATLYLLSPDGRQLVPTALRLQGQEPDPALTDEWAAREQGAALSGLAGLQQGQLLERELHSDDVGVQDAYAQVFKRLKAQRLRLEILPLMSSRNELIGALSLGFADLQPGQGLSSSRVAFIQALAGPAAVAIENQLLLQAQRQLLESLIQLVAGAIDAKSAYTGGHCQRVPELTKALAEAACEAREGPFADYSLSEERREALHIAAWLHDCGKVTTPEYVVDKATKLETLYDRIHEIRMRFELLKQQAYLHQCEAALREQGVDLAALRAAAEPEQRQLDEDFAFVATCNEGGEFLSPDKQARLREIGSRRWLRTLDDRLGIAHEERRRKAQTPAPALPVEEALLADKPHHRVERAERDKMPPDNRWGFTLKQPELLYNLGELHNLSVSRGTLTEEERYKINEHMIQTIKMLSELPFPAHLRDVPEIAGGHHEKMDGSGYPRSLRREDMSPEARMMAIADVFEALTAADRPYKVGKRLSESLKIMRMMTQEQHLDPALFNLFLGSGVCLAYARRYMSPEQIDVEDLGAYAV